MGQPSPWHASGKVPDSNAGAIKWRLSSGVDRMSGRALQPQLLGALACDATHIWRQNLGAGDDRDLSRKRCRADSSTNPQTLVDWKGSQASSADSSSCSQSRSDPNKGQIIRSSSESPYPGGRA